MKPLFFNKKLGRILYAFFSEEAKDFARFTIELAHESIKSPKTIKEKFRDGHFDNKIWVELQKLTSDYVQKNIDKITSDKNLFVGLFFEGKEILFVLYALEQYIKSKRCKNKLFKEFIESLFIN